MNNNALHTSESLLVETSAVPPADVLRTLLDAPKSKDEVWQAEAGRAVSMLATQFLNETSDESALRTVGLLCLAQALGVKEARKRTLKLTRWTQLAPPPLTILVQRDEQHSAMTALAKPAMPWSRRYAEQTLTDESVPEVFVPDLLKWVRSTYVDNSSFIRESYGPLVAASKTTERIATLLKEAGKLLKSGGGETLGNLAEGIAELVEAFSVTARSEKDDEKPFVVGVVALLHLMQFHASVSPAILLEPAFVGAVGRLSSATSKGAASKQVDVVSDALLHATISLLVAEFARYGKQAANHWKALVPIWRFAYKKWDSAVADATKSSPSFAAILSAQRDDLDPQADTYSTEAVFARLLPAWTAFVAEFPDASRAASLSAMLHEAAGTLGIGALGEAGSVVSYDPLSHHIAGDDGSSARQVRVLRPGVQVQRPDGSVRVLVAALVAAV